MILLSPLEIIKNARAFRENDADEFSQHLYASLKDQLHASLADTNYKSAFGEMRNQVRKAPHVFMSRASIKCKIHTHWVLIFSLGCLCMEILYMSRTWSSRKDVVTEEEKDNVLADSIQNEGIGDKYLQNVAIVHTGLRKSFIWEPTFSHVVQNNPTIFFQYFIILQDTDALRFTKEKYTESFDKDDEMSFMAAIEMHPNCDLRYMVMKRTEFVPEWYPSPNMIFPGYPKHMRPFGSDIQQFYMVKEAHMKVIESNVNFNFVLRLREDALWFEPLIVDDILADRITFLSCRDFGGVPDKAWIAPANLGLTFAFRIYMEMWQASMPMKNSESMLKSILECTNTSYSILPHVSDGKRRDRMDYCFRQQYVCYSYLPVCDN